MNRNRLRLIAGADLDSGLLAFEATFAAQAAGFRPRSAELGNVRRAVLAAFEAPPVAARPVRHRFGAPLSWRLSATALALVLLAGSGQFASRAGEPGQVLYPARLAAEDAWSTVTAGQGWQGGLDRLTLRLRDAEAMAARGDAAGVDAALSAYAGALADLRTAARQPGADTSDLAAALESHEGALAAVGAAVSGSAADLARQDGQAVRGVIGELGAGNGGGGAVPPGGMRRDGRADWDRGPGAGWDSDGRSTGGAGSWSGLRGGTSSGAPRTAAWSAGPRTGRWGAGLRNVDRSDHHRWRR